MKKLTNLIAAGAIALSFSMPTVHADPGKGPGNDAAAFCKSLVEADVVSSVGECMGIIRADNAPAQCKFWDYLGVLELIGFKNRGDCVSTLREFGV